MSFPPRPNSSLGSQFPKGSLEKPEVVVNAFDHTFNSSSREAEAGESLIRRPAWSRESSRTAEATRRTCLVGGAGLEDHCARSQRIKSGGGAHSLMVPERPYRPRSPTVEVRASDYTSKHPDHSRISPLHYRGPSQSQNVRSDPSIQGPRATGPLFQSSSSWQLVS